MLLPVLDLLAGQVVRGMAGRRSEYRPITSRLAQTADVPDVAEALVREFAFRDAYVADLDAIGGAEPDWSSYGQISAAGLDLWLDAGAGSVARLAPLLEFHQSHGGLERLVIGLESLAGPEALQRIVERCYPGRLVFSLDLKDGVPLTKSETWRETPAAEIAAAAIACGITSLILLDLANVGMYQGVGTEELCRTLRARYPHVQLIGGGGVRSMDDARRLAAAGFDRVLVASALHDGRITPVDCAQ